jgi:hypothetical protein
MAPTLRALLTMRLGFFFLILRSIARRCVSKDASRREHGSRRALAGAPHHEVARGAFRAERLGAPLYRRARFVTSPSVAMAPLCPDGLGALPDAVVAELVDALA